MGPAGHTCSMKTLGFMRFFQFNRPLAQRLLELLLRMQPFGLPAADIR